MSVEECLQEPTTFQEVSVSFTEETVYTLDPYLFALSGNDIQQYCGILSLLEQEKRKPEMFLETPQGISVPLSLVQVAEEFELLRGSYQDEKPRVQHQKKQAKVDIGDDGTAQTKLLESLLQGSDVLPLIQMQYDFAPVAEEAVLQGNLPDSLTASELQPGTERRNELITAGSNLSKPSEPLKAQPAWKGQVGDFSATMLPQKGSSQPVMEEKRPLSDSQPSLVYEETQSTARSELCPTCGRKHQPSLNPTPFQPSPSQKESFECPDCGHSLNGGPAEPTEDQIPSKGLDKFLLKFNLAHCLNLRNDPSEKPFNCPDCGKGFVHQSSIPRHRKLHRKENFSPIFGQERSPNLDLKPLSNQKLISGKEKPTYHLVSETGKAKKQSDVGCQGASTLSSACVETDSQDSEPCTKHAGVEKPFRCSECGRSFSQKYRMMQHQKLHLGERPFKCSLCDKSYGQKSHLNRHHLQKHSDHLIQREAP